MVLDNLKEALDNSIHFFGTRSYIGFGLAFIGLITGIHLETIPAQASYHPLQICAWIFTCLVGLGTVLALIKTHTTLFDKIKWIKKK